MLAFAGMVTFSPVLVLVKLKRMKRWLMSLVWVVDPARMKVTWLMEATSGVPTKTVWPYPALVGAELMLGRAPAKRYGGENSCAFAPPTFPPAESTRPSGSSSAVE